MLVPKNTLVLVVDGQKLSMFRNVGDVLAPELELILHREEHSPSTAEQGSDQPGRSFQSQGQERSAYETPDYHVAAKDHFAVDASHRLHERLTRCQSNVILIAPPHILHVMREHLSPEVTSRVIMEIDKDYSNHQAADVAKFLVNYGA